MVLLIDRDRTSLVPCEGKAFLRDKAPEAFQQVRVVPKDLTRIIEARSESDDLLIDQSYDEQIKFDIHFNQTRTDGIPSLWSGYRSNLVMVRGEWYRIKGVSLDIEKPETTGFDDGHFWIEGGQKFSNVGFERNMSAKFNETLRNEGIEPVMEYVGLWKYPNKANGIRPAASIYNIKGDTRLDELMFVLDNHAFRKIHSRIKDMGDKNMIEIAPFNRYGEIFQEEILKLYYAIGQTSGRLKQLMYKSGQTWSCDSERSNAHIGNIVVYNDFRGRLRVGLVDFDASCDRSELTRTELEDISNMEYNNIITSALSDFISLREIGGAFNHQKIVISEGITPYRKAFIDGFEKGYQSKSGIYSDIVELDVGTYENHAKGLLENVFMLLRHPCMFNE